MNVRIVLCYTDAAGSANSASPMVNKLTLSLTGTDGTSKAPYPFESFDLSNTQVIDVTSKATFTTWTVKVTATSISSSPQVRQPPRTAFIIRLRSARDLTKRAVNFPRRATHARRCELNGHFE